jgi:hypothetical protein
MKSKLQVQNPLILWRYNNFATSGLCRPVDCFTRARSNHPPSDFFYRLSCAVHHSTGACEPVRMCTSHATVPSSPLGETIPEMTGGKGRAGQLPFAFTGYEESLNTSLALSPWLFVHAVRSVRHYRT